MDPESVAPKTLDEVFVGAVRDHLEGTPNASHPVQFEYLRSTPLVGTLLVACTLCGSAVHDSDEWKELHRKNHDDHNKVHGEIETLARRYVDPPRYG